MTEVVKPLKFGIENVYGGAGEMFPGHEPSAKTWHSRQSGVHTPTLDLGIQLADSVVV